MAGYKKAVVSLDSPYLFRLALKNPITFDFVEKYAILTQKLWPAKNLVNYLTKDQFYLLKDNVALHGMIFDFQYEYMHILRVFTALHAMNS